MTPDPIALADEFAAARDAATKPSDGAYIHGRGVMSLSSGYFTFVDFNDFFDPEKNQHNADFYRLARSTTLPEVVRQIVADLTECCEMNGRLVDKSIVYLEKNNQLAAERDAARAEIAIASARKDQWCELSEKLGETIRTQAARIADLERACSQQNDAICQTLGRALKFPRYADDPANFPDVSPDDLDVCVGEHVAETLADAAAKRIGELEAEAKRLRAIEHAARAYVDAKHNYPQVAGELWRDLCRELGLEQYQDGAIGATRKDGEG